MKHIYLILLIAFTASNTFAQRKCDVELSHYYIPTPSTTPIKMSDTTNFFFNGGINGTHPRYYWLFFFKNLGPDVLKTTDTFLLKTAYNLVISLTLPIDVQVGDSLNWMDTLLANTVINPNSSFTKSGNYRLRWCDSVWLKSSPADPAFDTNLANNFVCDTPHATIWVTSVNDLDNSNSMSVYPNPARNNITIKYKYNNSDAAIIIRSVTGQIMYRKNLGRNLVGEQTHNIDISTLSPGIYMIELDIDRRKTTSKLVVY